MSVMWQDGFSKSNVQLTFSVFLGGVHRCRHKPYDPYENDPRSSMSSHPFALSINPPHSAYHNALKKYLSYFSEFHRCHHFRKAKTSKKLVSDLRRMFGPKPSFKLTDKSCQKDLGCFGGGILHSTVSGILLSPVYGFSSPGGHPTAAENLERSA